MLLDSGIHETLATAELQQASAMTPLGRRRRSLLQKHLGLRSDHRRPFAPNRADGSRRTPVLCIGYALDHLSHRLYRLG